VKIFVYGVCNVVLCVAESL